MIRRLKHTGTLVALLIGLFLAAHELIPHHHDYDIYCSQSGQDDRSKKDAAGDHDDSPFKHCHAFNEIYVDKAAQNQSLLSVTYETPHPDSNADRIKQTDIKSRLPVDPEPNIFPLLSFIYTDSPLRAPPFSV